MVVTSLGKDDNMTEQQSYRVVDQLHQFELRSYPPCVMASIEVTSSFEQAGNSGFMALVNYIRGNNLNRNKIAMTAPVLQEPGVKISQQYPVIETSSGDSHTISFVMPANWTIDNLPDPLDPRIVIREIPSELVATSRFSGRWSQRHFQKELETLTRRIKQAGYEITGPVRFARFDPPWTPWFMRRNEIQIPVQKRS